MAFNKIEILCRTLQWDSNVEYKKRSFFNSDNIPTVGNTINLMEYCIELGDISFNSIGDNIAEDINALFYEAGDVKVKLSGIKNNKFLVDYFKIFDTTGILQYRQYPVEIRYDGNTIFAGIVTQDSIKENYSTAKDSEVINIQIVGLEKEFKNYFSNKALADHAQVFSAVNGDTYRLGWDYDRRSEDNGETGAGLCRSKSLRGVLVSNFNTDKLIIKYGLADQWFCNNIPQFFWNPLINYRTWFMRTGYKRFQQEGYSVYELFEKICNAMGWIWYIKRRAYISPTAYQYELIIENRKDISNNILEIDYQKIKELDIGYQLNKTDYEYIIIPDGHINSNGFYHTAGNAFKMATKKINPIINNSLFFGAVTGNPTGYQLYPYAGINTKYSIENNKAEKKYDWAEIRYNGNPNWNDNRIIDRKFIKSDKIVYLDAGEHSNMKTVVDTSNGLNYPATEMGESETDIIYSGNCGSMLFKYFPYSIGEQNYGMDYNEYTQTDVFADNFKSILNNINNQTIQIEYKGLIFDVNKVIKINNSGKEFYDISIFSITDLKINLIDEISTITLVRN